MEAGFPHRSTALRTDISAFNIKDSESKSTTPYFNLALEEYVFERMDRTKEYFMLWLNYNTIVVGKHRNTAEKINRRHVLTSAESALQGGFPAARLYNDKGNLNSTLIGRSEQSAGFQF